MFPDCHFFLVWAQYISSSPKNRIILHYPDSQADQGRIGTYNFVVPGLSEPLF